MRCIIGGTRGAKGGWEWATCGIFCIVDSSLQMFVGCDKVLQRGFEDLGGLLRGADARGLILRH